MRYLLPALLSVAIVLAGCNDTGERAIQPEPDTTITSDTLSEGETYAPLRNLSHHQKLMLIDEVPLGLTYIQIQQLFPDVGPLTPEGMGAHEHLTEARLETQVWDRDAEIEFNFDSDSLYSYYYHLSELDCVDGDSLYSELQEFYSDEFGELREEDEAESGYRARSSYWTLEDPHGGLAVTLSNQADVCRLGWGFQHTAP